MFFRASLISSPIIEALSSPLREKAMVDQNTMSLSRVLGIRVSALNSVAEPKRLHATTASTISNRPGIQRPTAPRLCSHLPTASPRTLRPAARASASREKPMK